MTCGIYKLYWEEDDSVYIGQSINVEGRITTHLRKMRTGKHQNNKIQDRYDEYGDPTLSVQACTSQSELDAAEAWYIDYYQAYGSMNGLNLTRGNKTDIWWSPSSSDVGGESIVNRPPREKYLKMHGNFFDRLIAGRENDFLIMMTLYITGVVLLSWLFGSLSR